MDNEYWDEMERWLMYGDGTGDEPTGMLSADPFLDYLPEEVRGRVFDNIIEEIKRQPPLRHYTPDNPPMKDWISNLPITVPVKPEFIRPKIDHSCPFEINKTSLEKMIEECCTPLQIITTEEKTVMQAKAVFDLYFKRARAALDKAAEDKFHELVDADENVQKIKSTFDKLNDDLSTSGFRPKRGVPEHQLNIYCTKETRKLVDKWSKEETDERHRLDLMQEEVEAQLLSCETYEQARAILRAYNIINNAGEMQDYQPF